MDNNDAVSSQPLTEETTTPKRHQFTISTTPPPLSTLPFELMVEILCRLPVKSLLQFRCVCKSWNSLISDDTKFAKKHLRTTDFTRHHLILGYTSDFLLTSSSLLSVFNDVISPSTQLEHPLNNGNPLDFIVGSCDGIICLAIDQCFALLWNPLTRRFKKLPPLENSLPLSVQGFHKSYIMYGFGYDHVTGRYKVVAVFHPRNWIQNSYTTHVKVKVHTLGTDSWRTIQEEFPLGTLYNSSGRFVSGTLNWLVDRSFYCVIISLDLGKECYRELLLPPGCGRDFLSLGVLRDCLSISAFFDCEFLYVWLMKEYGNEESWTILFSVTTSMEWDIFPTFPFVRNTLHVSENDQVLLELEIDQPSRVLIP